MAHKKGQGSTRNGRDSNPQFRGVKLYSGETVRTGGIIVRQRGSKVKAGFNTLYGRDWTVYATADGIVRFSGGKVHVDKPKGQIAIAKA